MKHVASARRSPRRTTSQSRQDAPAAWNAIAIAPPAYGIDFVDRDLKANAGPLLQGKFATNEASAQVQDDGAAAENKTGLPDRLKAGLEKLSGMDLSGVRVHYNSASPARLNAHAFTQGSDIHVAPGQEKHLPHEGWHVVQQMQGRVKPTMQAKDVAINDDAGLEREADAMGGRAVQMRRAEKVASGPITQTTTAEPRAREPTEVSEIPSMTIGTSREKVRLNFLSTRQAVSHISKLVTTAHSVQRGRFKDEEDIQSKPISDSSPFLVQRMTGVAGGLVTTEVGVEIQRAHGSGQSLGHVGVVQRITHNGVDIDIDTLSLVDSRTHLGRLMRLRNNAGQGNDHEYAYDPADQQALRDRMTQVAADERETRRIAVVTNLQGQLAGLATANVHNPPWAPAIPTGAAGNEVINNQILQPDQVSTLR